MKPTILLTSLLSLAGAMTMDCDLSFTPPALSIELRDDYTAVALPGCVPTWEVGAPSLPIQIVQLCIPQGTRIGKVTVVSPVPAETIPVTCEVWPVQEPRQISDDSPHSFTLPDPEYYDANPYPLEVAVAGKRGSMFGYNIASIFVAPVQYTSSQKTLVFHPELRLEIKLVPDDYVQVEVVNRSEKARTRIESTIRRLVRNPEDVFRYAP